MKAIKVKHAAEIWTTTGPTGRFAEVIRGELQDYGGNIVYRGTADQCVKEKEHRRGPLRMVPTEWSQVDGIIADADYCWDLVME